MRRVLVPSRIQRTGRHQEFGLFQQFQRRSHSCPTKGRAGGSSPPSRYSRGMESATEVAGSVKMLESLSPTTGEVVGSVATITPDEVEGIVDKVGRIQPAWAQLTLKDRGRYMLRAADALL